MSSSPLISRNRHLGEEHTRKVQRHMAVSRCPWNLRNAEGTPLLSMSVSRHSLITTPCVETPRPPQLLLPDVHSQRDSQQLNIVLYPEEKEVVGYPVPRPCPRDKCLEGQS